VEIKSVETVVPLHKKQLLTHLLLAHKRLGLLINSTLCSIKEGSTAFPMACQIDLTQKTPRCPVGSRIPCEKLIYLAGLRRRLVRVECEVSHAQ